MFFAGVPILIPLTLALGSQSFKKDVSLDQRLVSAGWLCDCLQRGEWQEKGELVLRDIATGTHRIVAVREPACGEDSRGTHVRIEFEWLFKPDPPRKYGGEVMLLTRKRVTAGSHGTAIHDPLELEDYSMRPVQHWQAYTFGWWDEWTFADDSRLAIGPLSSKMRECISGEPAPLQRNP